MNNYINSIRSIYYWLDKYALSQIDNKYYVKERYSISEYKWYTIRRPFYMIQTAYAYYLLWDRYRDSKNLEIARDLIHNSYEGINEDGCFIYDLDGQDQTIYLGGNSEIVIYLCLLAEIDKTKSAEYISVAGNVVEWILSKQASNGGFAMNSTFYSPLGTGHAIAALSTYYKYASNEVKGEIESAIENGIAFLNTKQLSNGRFLCCNEISAGHEIWRSPSSDHCIALRGIAMCEYFLNENNNIETWKTIRDKAAKYLCSLVNEKTGAVVNGEYNGVDGTKINNADFNFLVDHVYTTRYAIEVFEWLYKISDNYSYMAKALKLCSFCNGNVYTKNGSISVYGVLRGGYNLQEMNWDTSALILNGIQEGGADMVYVGSVNAPILSLLIRHNDVWSTPKIAKPSDLYLRENDKIMNVAVFEESDV